MTRAFRQLREPSRHVLVPFDPREVTTVSACARMVDYDPATVRRLVGQYELGRRLGAGPYMVSKVAWALFVNGDWDGLHAYHVGDRQYQSVRREFVRIGMAQEAA